MSNILPHSPCCGGACRITFLYDCSTVEDFARQAGITPGEALRLATMFADLDPAAPDEAEPERMQAIAALIDALPPRDILLRWAAENRPPQSWFDEDHDLL